MYISSLIICTEVSTKWLSVSIDNTVITDLKMWYTETKDITVTAEQLTHNMKENCSACSFQVDVVTTVTGLFMYIWDINHVIGLWYR